jgi:hypothetical protein
VETIEWVSSFLRPSRPQNRCAAETEPRVSASKRTRRPQRSSTARAQARAATNGCAPIEILNRAADIFRMGGTCSASASSFAPASSSPSTMTRSHFGGGGREHSRGKRSHRARLLGHARGRWWGLALSRRRPVRLFGFGTKSVAVITLAAPFPGRGWFQASSAEGTFEHFALRPLVRRWLQHSIGTRYHHANPM